VLTNIALWFLKSDPFQVLLSKNQFPGSREFPGNRICIPTFLGMTKWLSRGNTSRNLLIYLIKQTLHALWEDFFSSSPTTRVVEQEGDGEARATAEICGGELSILIVAKRRDGLATAST
jgi:hypothetical protein